MAGRVVTQLIAQGAKSFIEDFVAAGQAVTQLAVRLADAERVRTPQLAPNIEKVRETLDQASDSAARFATDISAFVSSVNEANKSVFGLLQTLESSGRVRTPQLAEQFKAVTTAAERTLVVTLQTVKAEEQLAEQARRVAIQQNLLAQRVNIAGNPNNLGAFNASTAGIRNPSGQQLVDQLRQHTIEADKVAIAEAKKAKAIKSEDDAQSGAQKSGITYLSVLSAIHAASFLASNRTFTLIGSFVTLGLAFSKAGVGFAALGLALGSVLAIFGQIEQGVQRIVQFFTFAVQTIVTGAAAIVAASVAAAGAGVKIAAGVESELALVQAITGSAIPKLQELSAVITTVGLRFGISSQEVAQGASLFVRAGGNIEEAINGATEAIAKLTIASAGELKAAEAARTISTLLKAFKGDNIDAAKAADAVTAAAQRSALTFTEVNQAFQQAIPGSVTFGISLRDLSTIIVALGENLRGTVAGTSFKQFLLDLTNPSKQAREELTRLGVSIVNVADPSKIRPVFDVINDLSRALAGLTQPERIQALNKIFESRAGLAGNLLSKQTVETLQKLRAELDAVSASKVVDVLLLPLNRQLERLKVTVEEVGRAFGGPFLEPIRSATVAAVNFFTSLIGPARLLGQTISVVLTNEGFGALRQKIAEFAGGNVNLSVFLQELVNSFRNVRDVIVSQIIPAIQDFAKTVGSALQLGGATSITKTFEGINKAIQVIGASTAVLIRNFGLLVKEFITGKGEGGKLRDQMELLATALITRVGTSLVTTAIFTAVAARAMIAFGDISSKVAKSIGGILAALASVAEGLSESFVRLGLKAQKGLAGIRAGFALQAGDIEGFKQAAQEIKDLDTLLRAPAAISNPLSRELRGLEEAASGADKVSQALINSLSPEALTAKSNEFITRFQKLGGNIKNELSNLNAQIDEERRKFEVEEPTQGAPGGADVGKLKAAQDKIIEAGHDFARKLNALNEDTATKAQEIATRAIEKIDDIFTKANQQLAKLSRETKERIDELNQAFAQRRTERGLTETLQQDLDRRLQLRTNELELEVEAEQRALETVRLLRSRATEDAQRAFDIQAGAAERSFARQQQAAEQAFSNQQRARDRALEQSQNAEERALQASLKSAADQRKLAQDLASAKTPEERARVQSQAAQAASDAQFAAGQQAQLDALKARHDAQQESQRRQSEIANTAFRNSQEDATLRFRLAAEKVAIDRRRGLEDQERAQREQEELQQQLNREHREDTLLRIRTDNARKLQQLQDDFDEQNHKRQLDRIQREADERRGDIVTERNRQLGEVIENVEQQFRSLQDTQGKTLRGLQQSFDDLIENLDPATRGGAAAQINAVQALINQGISEANAQLDLSREKAQAVIDAARTIGEAKVGLGAGLSAARSTETQVSNVRSMVVSSLTLPPNTIRPNVTVNVTVTDSNASASDIADQIAQAISTRLSISGV